MNNNEEINSEIDVSETGQLHVEFAKLLNKILTSLDDDLFEEVNENLLQKCRVSNKQDHIIISHAIQDIVKLLVRKLESAKVLVQMYKEIYTRDINKKDYEMLEKQLQKRQEEIRNHYRQLQQNKICEMELLEKSQLLQRKLQDVKVKLRQSEQELERMVFQRKTMLKKMDKYEEKIYEMNREGAWNSVQNKSSDKLLHKASLNMKNRTKMEPYLEGGGTKSRQVISRNRQGKVNRQKGSRVLCFDSVKMRYEPNQGLPTKKTSSYHGSKILTHNTKTQHNNSVHIGETQKRRKLRFAKQITEVDDRKQRNSLYI